METLREQVIVLAGGLSHERDVSLRSGRRVASALRARGHVVHELDPGPDLIETVRSLGPVVAVPLVHGEAGEDGALLEVLSLLDVPTVGAGPDAARRAFDKSIATPLMAEAGASVPRQVALPSDVFRQLGAHDLVRTLARRPGLPLMVKPARGGSSLGCTRVDSVEALPQAMVTAFGFGSLAVIEEFVDGTEVAVGVIDTGDGPRALPAVEIRPVADQYDYAARYTAGSTRFVAPAELSPEVERRCAALALLAHRTFGFDELSRTDMIVRDGVPVFLETNVAPGMTETSLVPLALRAAGLELGSVFSALVRGARRRAARPETVGA